MIQPSQPDATASAPSPAEPTARADGGGRLKAFYELTKPGIAGYVMITAGVTYFVGARGHAEMIAAVHAMVGTGLATAGALALNQHAEREEDRIMFRTRGRPLPLDRLRPAEALAFGAALLATGLMWLALLSGLLPAALAAFSAAAYHGVYTPLKKRSFAATLTGAVPGALPALIGWTAATGAVDVGGLALFAIAYLWQLPHVLGLAWMLREDYARVGFKLVPAGGGRVIGGWMVAATGALLPVSLAPFFLGLTGRVYLSGALLASGAFLWVAVRAARHLTDASARRVFFGSLLYHPVLLGLLLFDTVRL